MFGMFAQKRHYLAPKSKNDSKKSLKMEDADNVSLDVVKLREREGQRVDLGSHSMDI